MNVLFQQGKDNVTNAAFFCLFIGACQTHKLIQQQVSHSCLSVDQCMCGSAGNMTLAGNILHHAFGTYAIARK